MSLNLSANATFTDDGSELQCAISQYIDAAFALELEISNISQQLYDAYSGNDARFVLNTTEMDVNCSGTIDYII